MSSYGTPSVLMVKMLEIPRLGDTRVSSFRTQLWSPKEGSKGSDRTRGHELGGAAEATALVLRGDPVAA